MRFIRLCSCLLALVLTIACGSTTEPVAPALHGTWVAAAETASPSGWYERSLTFDGKGSFAAGLRIYGIYSWQPSDELSAYQRTEGTYEIDGDRLVFHAARLVWWDRYYGAQSPEQISEPYPYGTIFDNARFVVRDRQLILHFTVYPVDAPEPAVLVFNQAQ